MSMLFAHPWLLMIGASLISVPILIHLFNKRKFKVVHWAAMDLLKQAENSNRKRLRFEELIILLLRCLIVLLLAFLVSRLFIDLSGMGMKENNLASVERLILLDDSPSMDIKLANRSQFDEHKKALANFVRRLGKENPGDTLTIILTSRPLRPVCNGQVISRDNTETLAATINAIPCSDISARPGQALQSIQNIIEKEGDEANRLLYILSDFNELEWDLENKNSKWDIAAHLASLQEHIQEGFLLNTGVEIASNLAILNIECLSHHQVQGIRSRYRIEVQNTALVDSKAATLKLAFKGEPAIEKPIPGLAPGAKHNIECSLTPNTSGSSVLTAKIEENDQWQYDNSKEYSSIVYDSLDILIVDGEPNNEQQYSESYYLEHALAPRGEEKSGIKVQVMDEKAFNGDGPGQAKLIFLCNVFNITQTQIKNLNNWVQAGGGLVIFPGDQSNPDFWNETFSKHAPDISLPKFTETEGHLGEGIWENLSITHAEHPILQIFKGKQNPFLNQVKFYRHWVLDTNEKPSLNILAEYTKGHPAIVESDCGLGKVLCFASSADTEWSSWPRDPSYVVCLQEIAHSFSGPRALPRNLVAGSPLWHEIDPSVINHEGKIITPDNDSTLLRTQQDAKGRYGFQMDSLDHCGLWKLNVKTYDEVKEDIHYAVSIDSTESRFKKLDQSKFLAALPMQNIHFVEGSRFEQTQSGGHHLEMSPSVGIFLLLILFLEQVLAWFFRKRNAASTPLQSKFQGLKS